MNMFNAQPLIIQGNKINTNGYQPRNAYAETSSKAKTQTSKMENL